MNYDYGSTAELEPRVAGIRDERVEKPGIVLLARNQPPVWQCVKCGKPAKPDPAASAFSFFPPTEAPGHLFVLFGHLTSPSRRDFLSLLPAAMSDLHGPAVEARR